MAHGYGTPAIKRDEDLGVLHALAAELGMNLASVFADTARDFLTSWRLRA